MYESFNYLGSQFWRIRGQRTNSGTLTLKTCPAPTDTPLVSGGVADAGGSTTTMIDAARTEADDFWNDKQIRFTSGANSGLVRRITDFVASSDTMTFAPAVNAAVGAGDTYDIIGEETIVNRLVMTGYSIAGTNTAGTVATWSLRHLAGNQEVILGGQMAATTGLVNKDNANVWLPMIANQSLQLVTANHTGEIDVMVMGRIFPETVALADFYDGAAH